MQHINRREFLKTATAGLALAGLPSWVSSCQQQTAVPKNKLPRWRGFNILDFFPPQPFDNSHFAATEQDFKWIADWGFDFVRIPMAYPGYLNYNPATGIPITPEQTVDFNEEAIEIVEKTVNAAHKQGLHVSLSLHRAPGYCINAGFQEPFYLWEDAEAKQAFYTHWDMWAKRFKHVSSKLLSFDLVNEPCHKQDMNEQFCPCEAVPAETYREVVKGCLDVIHKQTPDRLVVANGKWGGSSVVPELEDLPVAQSCRGYHPHYVSHYRTDWVWKNPDDAPTPAWPGTFDGKEYNRKTLEEYYQPWIELVKKGVGVHCGECGCHNQTPHEVFLAWFNDVLDILTSAGIGWGLWNFRGGYGFGYGFGVLDSGRKDVQYEDFHGHQLDRKFLKLLQKY